MQLDRNKYGVSFSVKQCRNFGVEPKDALDWLLKQGWRRFRLMSYWNECEKTPGKYDFRELDRQIRVIKKKDGMVTLCLGVKQPRWPEYHWPEWALHLNPEERKTVLLRYVSTVVKRYKGEPIIVSWQLENEALLSNFGEHIQIDRARLRAEYQRIRQLDPSRPIIMSTSNGWGIPLRRPWPKIVGFSLYTVMYQKGAYRSTVQKLWLYRLRKLLIVQKVFVHELQCEPWGPKAIWEMTVAEQNESMSQERIAHNIATAKKLGACPIDLWGAEWWYWRSAQGDESVWKSVESALKN